MVDNFHEKQAKLIVNYSIAVKKGDKVLIRAPAAADPLIKELYKEIIIAGGHPFLMLHLEDLDPIFYEYAQPHQLDFKDPYYKYALETLEARIYILGSYNTRQNSSVPPEKIARRNAALRELFEIQTNRVAAKELRTNIAPFATSALAQEANMSRREFQRLIIRTLFLDKDNPVAEWRKVSKKQQVWKDYLDKVEELHIVGEDTDLKMSVSGRTWYNCDGKRNLPDGELFSAPVDDSATGEIRFAFPGIFQGNEINDIRLTFAKGKVVKAKAAQGEDFLQKIIQTDAGAERLGEIGIGTNPGVTKLTRSILFDEKMGGTIHLALGISFPEVGGTNKSGIHWDILAKPDEIYADNELIWKAGEFTI
ncbi:MAG: aminopeptidase [Candidatus Hodarchaeales archaeon]|jgi:aminopeptidase